MKETDKSFPCFNRRALKFFPLSERENRADIREALVSPETVPPPETEQKVSAIKRAAASIRAARKDKRPVILAFGAHAIKNGLGPVIAELAEKGWLTHLAANGAGVIHDWEFAYQGRSSEKVAENAAAGHFGMWQETGSYLNLALASGSYRLLGYGESVGTLIAEGGCPIPDPDNLRDYIISNLMKDPEGSAVSADFLSYIKKNGLTPGFLTIHHPFKNYSLQYRALKAGVPFTAHPMFGHDIIYTHPWNQGSAVGRTAETDFLRFVESISGLEGGVYLSVGSAVMSPMIFEKSLSMARNLAFQRGGRISSFKIFVIDLSVSSWDWSKGEPPETDPAYYLRFLKSFSRMGGTMEYLGMDNRSFFLHLRSLLC